MDFFVHQLLNKFEERNAEKLIFNASLERIPKKSQGANIQGCRMARCKVSGALKACQVTCEHILCSTTYNPTDYYYC